MQKQASPTEYRLKLRERILEAASHEFFSRGIKAVKMDDIANILSISKRTLYEIYTNKEELLMETVKDYVTKKNEAMHLYASEPRSVIDVLLHFYQLEIKDKSSISPLYFTDLQKYPKVINWLKEKHDERQCHQNDFIEKGIEQGYLRDDVDYDLLSSIAAAARDYIMQNKFYKKYTFEHLFRNMVLLFFRGLCTPKGVALLDEKMKNLNGNT
jgi:AcrR family transcriptional regulator